MLDEASTTTRVSESFKLYSFIVNSDFLSKIPIVVFLNKTDVLKEKLKTMQFGDFIGNFSGINTFEAVIQYYEEQLRHGVRDKERSLTFYATNATDTEFMANVTCLNFRYVALFWMKF